MASSQAMTFQETLETLEALPDPQQDTLFEILHHRRRERRREELAASVVEARAEHERGETRCGSVEDLLRELTE